MCHNWKLFGQISAIIACCGLVSLSDQATAVQDESVLVEPVPPAEPKPPKARAPRTWKSQGAALSPGDQASYQDEDEGEVLSEEARPELVEPEMAEVDCCPSVPIEYDYKHHARRRYGPEPPIEMIMMVDDPGDGLDCQFEVPICIPACCTGDPQMRCWTGIFGRGFVEYRWSCGFQVEVEFKHHRGEIEVDYEG